MGSAPAAALYLKGPGDPSFSNWVSAFNAWLRSPPTNATDAASYLDGDGAYVREEAKYYELLKAWLASHAGARCV